MTTTTTTTTMTTTRQRLFAVLWWFLHLGAAYPFALGILLMFNPSDRPQGPWVISVIAVLPLVALAITRWVLTGQWRLGPRL